MGRPRKDGGPSTEFPDYPEDAVIEPWERQRNETAKAYAAFRLFRDLGPARSFAEVTRQVHGTLNDETERTTPAKRQRGRPRTKSHTVISRWAQKYDWLRRVTLWDQATDRMRMQQAAEEIRKMTERHISLAGMLQGQAAKRLRQLTDEDIEKMGLETVLKFIMQGTTLERLSRDLPTHRSATEAKVETEGKDEEARMQIEAAKQDFARKIEQMAARKSEQQNLPAQPNPTIPSGNRIPQGILDSLNLGAKNN
jgi:hypothetical protein